MMLKYKMIFSLVTALLNLIDCVPRLVYLLPVFVYFCMIENAVHFTSIKRW